jgi:hypothetical protein
MRKSKLLVIYLKLYRFQVSAQPLAADRLV